MADDNKSIAVETAIAKSSVIVFTGQISKLVLAYILVAILTRYLGVEKFGLYHLGATVILVAATISRMGLENGLVRFVSIYRLENDVNKIKGIFFTSIIFTLILSIIISFWLFFYKDAISQRYFPYIELGDVIRIIIYSLPFIASNFILFSVMQSFHASKYFTYITGFIDPLSKILIFLIFLFFGMGLYGMLYSHVITSIIVFLISLVVIYKISPIFKSNICLKCDIKKLALFSAPLSLAGIFQLSLDWADTIMLGHYETSKYVGIYAVTVKLSLIGTFVLYSVNYMFAPVISATFSNNDFGKLKYLFQRITRWIFIVTLPISLILIIYSKPLLGLFGNEIRDGALCLVILTVGQFINSLTGSVGYMLMMTGRSVLTLINIFAVCILNIILNYYLIPKYGIVGAAIATSISLSTINLIRLAEVVILLKMHPYNWQYLKPLFSGSVVGCIYYFFISITSFRIISSPLLILSFFVVYFLIIYFLGIDEKEKEILFKAKGKILCILG